MKAVSAMARGSGKPCEQPVHQGVAGIQLNAVGGLPDSPARGGGGRGMSNTNWLRAVSMSRPSSSLCTPTALPLVAPAFMATAPTEIVVIAGFGVGLSMFLSL
jgi:hypothetical protein